MRSSSDQSSSSGTWRFSARVATLVAVGTHEVPFHRLEAVVANLAGRGALPAPVFVQTGAGGAGMDFPASVSTVDFLAPAALEGLMRSARYVITHGGPGLIFMALEAGHRPIAVPRSAAHGEHVDDHQRAFVERMGAHGLVHALKEPAALNATLRSLTTTRQPSVVRPPADEPSVLSFAERFGELADSLVAAR